MNDSGKVLKMGAAPKSTYNDDLESEIAATIERREKVVAELRKSALSPELKKALHHVADPNNFRSIFEAANNERKEK